MEHDAVEGIDPWTELGVADGGTFGSAAGFFGLRHRVGSIDQTGGKIKRGINHGWTRINTDGERETRIARITTKQAEPAPIGNGDFSQKRTKDRKGMKGEPQISQVAQKGNFYQELKKSGAEKRN